MATSRRKRIGVLVGGDAPERELSLQSGEAVHATLCEAGHDAVLVHVDRHLDLVLRQERIELAFLALRGRAGEGPVQGLLETLGIPYTGSSLQATALAADKLKTKELLRLHNLPTPAWYCHRRGRGGAAQQHGGFGFPCVIKPRSGSSGIGVALARDNEELEAAVETALRLDDDAIVERFVRGCEVQVAVLDGQVLGAAERVLDVGVPDGLDVRDLRDLQDFRARLGARSARAARVFAPPRFGRERVRGLMAQALRAHQVLGCDGLTRVDLLVGDEENEHLLEVETLPDLAPGAPVPGLAQAAGLRFEELVGRILDGARLHAGRRLGGRGGTTFSAASQDRGVGGTVDPH